MHRAIIVVITYLTFKSQRDNFDVTDLYSGSRKIRLGLVMRLKFFLLTFLSLWLLACSNSNSELSDEFVGIWISSDDMDTIDQISNSINVRSNCAIMAESFDENDTPATYAIFAQKIKKSGEVVGVRANADGITELDFVVAAINENLDFSFTDAALADGDLPLGYKSSVKIENGVLVRTASWDGGESDLLVYINVTEGELAAYNESLQTGCINGAL